MQQPYALGMIITPTLQMKRLREGKHVSLDNKESLSLIKLESSFSELSSQLGPDFEASVFISANIYNFCKNPAKFV